MTVNERRDAPIDVQLPTWKPRCRPEAEWRSECGDSGSHGHQVAAFWAVMDAYRNVIDRPTSRWSRPAERAVE